MKLDQIKLDVDYFEFDEKFYQKLKQLPYQILN